MTSLDQLRSALHEAHKPSLEPFRVEVEGIDTEIEKLRKWIGGLGSSKPPSDLTAAAVNAFHRNRKLSNVREARFVCYGCLDPVLPNRGKLIEEAQAFPALLEEMDGYRVKPRAFRSCYRGLLHGYFGYEPDNGRADGRQNWERLRRYLHERMDWTTVAGWSPEWVETLRDNPAVLSPNPGETYGPLLLVDDDAAFKQLLGTLDINDASWLVRVSVLGQIDAAVADGDEPFRAHLLRLLELLARHPLISNEGLKRLLGRYRRCVPAIVHPGLRDYAVAQWGNPWLTSNATKWSLVQDDIRTMVADWLKLELIRQFFSLLAADGKNNPRRLKFWERYHDSIDDMYFALGNTAFDNTDADFRAIRKKMEGRLLNLRKGGSPNNNAFIMCIGRFVVVEFGLTGNACFVFRRDALPFELETYVNGDGTGLKGEPYVDRMLHTDSSSELWEEKFAKMLAKLMSVRPDVSAGLGRKPAGSTRFAQEATPVTPRPASPPTLPKTISSILQTPGARLADRGRKLEELCRERKIQIEDFRAQNGNQWVRTDDSDRVMNDLLRSWGFTYKADKGWWRK